MYINIDKNKQKKGEGPSLEENITQRGAKRIRKMSLNSTLILERQAKSDKKVKNQQIIFKHKTIVEKNRIKTSTSVIINKIFAYILKIPLLQISTNAQNKRTSLIKSLMIKHINDID